MVCYLSIAVRPQWLASSSSLLVAAVAVLLVAELPSPPVAEGASGFGSVVHMKRSRLLEANSTIGTIAEDGSQVSNVADSWSSADPCYQYLYLPACLSAAVNRTSTDGTATYTESLNCTWCCGAVTPNRCMSASSSCFPVESAATNVDWRITRNTSTATSPSYTEVTEGGGGDGIMYTTCEDICSTIGRVNNVTLNKRDEVGNINPRFAGSCAACTQAPFCYFCGSFGGTCIGGNGYCYNGLIVDDCQYLPGGSKGVNLHPDNDDGFFLNLSLQSTTMLLMIMMGVLCGLGMLLYMLPRFVRRRRERARLEALEQAWRRDFRNNQDGAPADGGNSAAPTPSSPNRDEAAPEGSRRTAPPPASAYPPPPSSSTPQQQQTNTPALTTSRQAADTATPAVTTAVPKNDNRSGSYLPTTIVQSTPSGVVHDDDDDDNTCLLCYEKPRTVVFIPCYHAYYCRDCSSRIRPTSGTFLCPSCRTPVEAMVDYCKALSKLD